VVVLYILWTLCTQGLVCILHFKTAVRCCVAALAAAAIFMFSLQGFVYLKMAAVEGAAAAFKMLHGRFYNGHMIQAAYQFVQVYDQHFCL
jgi:hypothetical protein